LSAVFANLLRNAVQSIDGQGRVVVSSRASDGAIEVRVEDNGPGLGAEELGRIFDPGFRVSGSRVGTGDWSLFGSRQVVQDHGGDIGVESGPGKGTVVIVRLPR
jgi:signal transduction histidine kinase